MARRLGFGKPTRTELRQLLNWLETVIDPLIRRIMAYKRAPRKVLKMINSNTWRVSSGDRTDSLFCSFGTWYFKDYVPGITLVRQPIGKCPERGHMWPHVSPRASENDYAAIRGGIGRDCSAM